MPISIRTEDWESQKAQYIEATMDYMENGGVFVTRSDKWFDSAANLLNDDDDCFYYYKK